MPVYDKAIMLVRSQTTYCDPQSAAGILGVVPGYGEGSGRVELGHDPAVHQIAADRTMTAEKRASINECLVAGNRPIHYKATNIHGRRACVGVWASERQCSRAHFCQ